MWPLVGFGAIVGIGLPAPPSSIGAMITAAVYVMYGLLALACVSSCRAANISLAEVMGPLPRVASEWAIPVLLAPLLLLLSVFGVWATLALISTVRPDWAARLIMQSDGPARLLDHFSTAQRALLAANIIVIGPVVEELAFRGVLLRRWASRGVWVGVFGSAAVFALLHLHQWIGAFMFAVVLGVVYVGTRSLFFPMVTHVVSNGLVTLAFLADDDTSSSATAAQALAEFREGWAVPLAGLLAAGAVVGTLIYPFVKRIRADRFA